MAREFEVLSTVNFPDGSQLVAGRNHEIVRTPIVVPIGMTTYIAMVATVTNVRPLKTRLLPPRVPKRTRDEIKVEMANLERD